MYPKKIVTILLLASLFAIKSFSQFTATWALTANEVGVKTGVQLTNVIIDDAVIGSAFTSNIGFGSNGVKCQPASGTDWVIAPTDGWHIDFPISPNGAVDVVVRGLTLTARQSGGSGVNVMSLAYQADGVGPFIPFGTPQITGSSSTIYPISFGTLSRKLYNGHTYIVRLYMYAQASGVSSSRSISIKSNVITGNTINAGTQPSVTTTTTIQTGKYTATATGVVTANSYTANQSGVVWDIATNPTISLATKNVSGPTVTGNIDFINGGSITGLTAATTYFARAFVVSETGDVFYGQNLSFTTDAPTIASLTTDVATNITSIKALSGGVIIDSGGVGITAKGVCWSTVTNPNISLLTKTNDGIGNTSFSASLKPLLPNTTYYAKAYATNSIGTAYGNEISFKTDTAQAVIISQTGNSANSLSFGNIIVNNVSTVQSYILSASSLIPLVGNITITAPNGFQVSLSPTSGFAAIINVPHTAGILITTTIYVRFSPTQFGAVSGIITHTGGGAITKNIDDVNVTGTGIQNPADFSNTGTDFWVGYGFQALMTGSNEQEMVLYISAKQDAIVTVEIGKPGDFNYYIQTYNVVANTATVSLPLPKSGVQDCRLNRTATLARGIHVYSNGVPFSLWEHIYANSSSGASLILPTNTWGSSYSVLTVGGKTNAGVPHSFFYVQAAEDNTIVDIIPSADITANASGTSTLYPANILFTAVLNKGEVFNALGKLIATRDGVDLTGTTVVSRDCNKKIALFTGNGRVELRIGGCTPQTGGSDNFLQQMFPKQAWGTKYVTSPFRDMEAGLYKIIVSDPATVVTVNGNIVTNLVQNAYSIETDTLLNIVSNKPVMVAQFCVANKCNGTGIPTHPSTGDIGDPEMVILSPVQQAINDVTVYSTNNFNILHNYVNVIIPTAGVANFLFDGANASASFSTHTADANYSYAVFADLVGNKSHRMQSDIAFNAIAYGFSTNGSNESYGYNAGTNIKTLTQYLTANNIYPNKTTDSVIATCLNNDFKYTVSLPYKPLSIKWDFFNNISQLPNSDTVYVNSPSPTDSSVVNGATLYKYSLPTTYKFTSIGTFPVNIIVNATNADGCSGLQTIKFSIKVVEPPTPHFLLEYVPSVCIPSTLNFTDSSYDKNGYAMNGREWTFFGNVSTPTSTDSVPTVSYFLPNSYKVNLRAINAIGCFKDTLFTAIVYNGPVIDSVVADNNGPDCAGRSILFTATTTSAIGTIIKYYWNFGDGTNDTTTTNTVSHTFLNANITGDTVTLYVESSAGCTSGFYQLIQPIYKIVSDFTFTSPQCLNTAVTFTNATIGASAATPIVANYNWSFIAANSTTSTLQMPLPVTYNTPGVYDVLLRVGLTKNGKEFCTDATSKKITIVSAINITNITANNSGVDCAGNVITYTAISNTPTATTKWFWEFSDGKKDTTSTAQINHSFVGTGLVTIKVFAKDTFGCVGSSYTLNQTIYKPKADFSFVSPQCVNTPITFTDVSTGIAVTAPIVANYNWSFGDVANTTSTTTGTVTFVAGYATPNTYNIKLRVALSNAGVEFCVDSTNPAKQIIINGILPKPIVSVNTIATSASSLTFNWAAIVGATGYQVAVNNGNYIIPSSGANGLSHTLTGLTPNTIHNICVKATGSCAGDSGCISGKTLAATTEFYVPTAFNPSSTNDLNKNVIICGNNDIANIRFIIFNQWGEKMYETTNLNPVGVNCFKMWNGAAFGKDQPSGVYAYVASITLKGADAKVINKKGLINLVW